jgi:hypothetical protein
MTNACRETGYAKVHNIKATTQGWQLWPSKFMPMLTQINPLVHTRHWSNHKVQNLHNRETIQHCVMWACNVTACLASPDMVCVAKGQNPFPK